MMYSLDNNYNAFREQATTADGQLRNKLYCDRMGVNHTTKPVMEDKDETWKYDIMFRVLEVRFYFANFISLSVAAGAQWISVSYPPKNLLLVKK